MDRDEFDLLKEFARTLPQRRVQVPDGQLLDQAQAWLDRCLAQLADEFEEAPHINEAEPPKKRSHHKKKT